MKTICTAAAFAVLLVVTACATPTANYVPQSTAFSRPPLNVATTVAVGEEMLSQGTQTDREGISLSGEARISGYTLSAGFYPMRGRDDNGAQYYTFFYLTAAPSGYGQVSKNFLVDEPQALMTTDRQGQLCVITVFNVRVCEQESFDSTRRTTESSDNFQQTLIYSGRIGDRIRLSYREFSGSNARPAFNNDAEYDLSVSDTVAYRGATIRVISADNTQITYEVLTNFNTPRN